MKKFLVLLSALLISISLYGSTSEAKTQTNNKVTQIDKLEVHYIDVGQGDATLIKCGDSSMLIDAGGDDKGTLVQNYIKKQGVKSLDYLIVTHPDSDHCGGADVIITKYDIGKVIMPNYAKDTATYRDVIKAMDNKRYKVTDPVVGDTYELGDSKFTIIAPNKEDYGDAANNYSVGILLSHGDKKFLFTGDAEEEAEGDILDNGIDISADVYKAGHHGSKTSSTQDFVEAIDPEYAVISCGENNEYGNPDAATLNTLRALNVKVFRTDEQGSLIATSDGKKITWNAAPSETWKAGEPTKASNIKSNSNKSSVAAVPKAETKQQESTPAVEEPKQEVQQDTNSLTYVLNVKTMKFHLPSCSYLPTTNRSDSTLSRDEIIGQGYVPCKKCNP